MLQHSPHRVQYGVLNPALQGVVITSDTVVPNFSWTPRLALPPEALEQLLESGTDDWRHCGGPLTSILLVPAVHGRVLRLFHHRDMWFLASNQRLEAVPARPEVPTTSHLVMLLETCLVRYNVPSAWHFTRDLDVGLCWFFTLYPGRQSMMFLGTCRVVPHGLLGNGMDVLDLEFAVHRHVPPAVPILPTTLPPSTRSKLLQERLHNPNTLRAPDAAAAGDRRPPPSTRTSTTV